MAILWVVDNSGSMFPFQESIVNATADFMSFFDTIKSIIDWRMELVTANELEGAYLSFYSHHGVRYFDHTYPNPVKYFQNTLQACWVVCGLGSEKSFLSVLNTLD